MTDFDLTQLVERQLRKNSFRANIQRWGFSALGALVAATGAYIGFVKPGRLWSYPYSVYGLVVVAVRAGVGSVAVGLDVGEAIVGA